MSVIYSNLREVIERRQRARQRIEDIKAFVAMCGFIAVVGVLLSII